MRHADVGSAALWSAVDIVGRQAVMLVVSIILARLLTPADFGAVAITAFFATLFTVVVQQGLSTAVIQRHGAAEEEVSSIFWWNVILSVIVGAAIIFSGQWLAGYFSLPVIGPLMIAAAAQIVLTSFGAMHSALLARDLRFAAITKASLPATILSAILGIGLAVTGMGVWALAAQLVSAAAFNSAALWTVSDWRPARVLRAAGLGDAVRFARWVSLAGGLEVLYSQGYALVLGKLYGVRDLGLYSRAANTQQTLANIISGIIGRVALPLFSARRGDPKGLRYALLSANRMAMVVALPGLAGLALTADLVIRILYGPQWVEAASPLAILAWAGAIYPLHANNLQLLLASGRSDLYFRLEFAKKCVGVVAVAGGSVFGIVGLAWSQLAFSIIALLINAWPSGRYAHCGLAVQINDLRGVLFATGLMALVVAVARQFMAFSPILEFAAVMILGAFVYVATGFLLRIRAFTEAIAIARSIKSEAH